MILPGIPSRLLMLGIISLMVILQTIIFVMSCIKEKSSSDETLESDRFSGVDNMPCTESYPFLTDPATVKYIATQIQVMIVLHGALPDKGALAQAIKDTYKDSAVCCFGRLDRKNLPGTVARSCQDQITDICKKGIHVIIVNSTGDDPSHLKDYFALAHQYNYTTLVVEPNATSSYDIKHRLQAACQHDCPSDADKTSPSQGITYPFFYGWFLGYDISLKTLGTGKQVYKECIRLREFLDIFKKYALPGAPRNSSGNLELDRYFSLEGIITGTTLLHCTSFFSNYSQRAGSKEYATSPAVQKAMGRAYNLTIIGFLITPRTLGARFLLDKEELALWSMHESFSSKANNSDKAKQVDNELNLSDTEKSTHDRASFTDEVKCPTGWHPTKYSPTCGPGSRAHLTMGLGKDIEAVQTGFDLDLIIQRELEAVAKEEKILTLSIDCGTVRHYGNGNWAVYLHKPFQIGTLFAAWY